MRAVHITSLHPPFDQRIFYKECCTLLAAGYGVHLMVFDPPHAEKDGVTFHALTRPEAGNRYQRVWRRAFNALPAALALEGDVYHLQDPELIPLGLALKRHGKRVIYDVHEDYRAEALGIFREPAWLRYTKYAVWSVFETLAVQYFDAIISATPAIARRFPPRMTTLVQNFPLLEAPPAGILPYAERAPSLAYIGGITDIQGIIELVQAMEYVTTPDARLVLAGAFTPPELQERVMALPGWQKVDFRGWVSRPEVQAILAGSRAGIVTYHPVPNHIESQPNKLFDYLLAGLPVIATDFPHWRQFVGKADCGLLVDPKDPHAIAQAIDQLLTHPVEAEAMGARGQAMIRETYNWDNEAQQLLACYERVLAGRPT